MKETNKRTTLTATSFILKHSDSWHLFLHFLHYAIHIQNTQTITHHYSFQILSNICCQSSSPPSALHQPSLSPPFTSSSVQLSILKFHCVFSSSSNSHLDTQWRIHQHWWSSSWALLYGTRTQCWRYSLFLTIHHIFDINHIQPYEDGWKVCWICMSDYSHGKGQ